ncbi:MAG: hypothetical protein F6K39_29465 [Okeania sp. SIO3B3]|nr:hypothetical protein [Okeania sp. SIO3B3]
MWVKSIRVEEGRRENSMGMSSINHFVSDNPNQFDRRYLVSGVKFSVKYASINIYSIVDPY